MQDTEVLNRALELHHIADVFLLLLLLSPSNLIHHLLLLLPGQIP